MVEFTSIVSIIDAHKVVSYAALALVLFLYIISYVFISKHLTFAHFRRVVSNYRNTATINTDNLQFQVTLHISTQPNSIRWVLTDYNKAMDLYNDLRIHYDAKDVAITFQKVDMGG